MKMSRQAPPQLKPQRRDERGEALEWMIRQYKSPNPVHQRDRVKVDKKAEFPTSQPQLTQKLGLMNRLKLKCRARLNDNATADQQLDFIRNRQRYPFVGQVQKPPALESQTP